MNFSSMTDGELDNHAGEVGAKLEIIARLATVRGFVTGLFGGVRFPKYDALPDSFKQADSAVITTPESFKTAGHFLADIGQGIFARVAVLLLLALTLYFVVKKHA